MAPKYKLTYFDARGRAEICRLLFAAAKVPFEDNRIGFEAWPALKSSTPFGSLPVLEIDNKQYAQAIALASYLAREFGLYGSTNKDGLIIDQLQQQREDLLIQLTKIAFPKDEASKEADTKKLGEETIPTTFGYFNKVIKENAGGKGYAVGDKLSLADLVIYEGTQFCVEEKLPVLDKYPEIKALREKVESGDAIKTYLSNRKQTSF